MGSVSPTLVQYSPALTSLMLITKHSHQEETLTCSNLEGAAIVERSYGVLDDG
eukprot:COSAG02_NODE_2337_length_9110_cov_417.266837_7_plen_53_part_00